MQARAVGRRGDLNGAHSAGFVKVLVNLDIELFHGREVPASVFCRIVFWATLQQSPPVADL